MENRDRIGKRRKHQLVTALIGLIALGSGIFALVVFVQSIMAWGILAVAFGGIMFLPPGLLSIILSIVFARRLRDQRDRKR